MKNTLVKSSLFFLLLLSATAAHSYNDLAQAKQLCNNATPQQKQMAKAAGYDVDSLCSSLASQTTNKQQNNLSSEPVVIPRVVVDSANKEQFVEKKTATPVKVTLKKFGYDLFAGEPTTQMPVAGIPVPMNYQIGVGDSINIQLYGKLNSSLNLLVNNDGSIQFPELGPIYVAGLSYSELKGVINQRVEEQMIGVQTNITLGELRSIQIFILGEAYKPGAYTVSSLSTMMNALHVSGGVNGIGSLRNIQLKRNGKVVSTLDLYDLLLKGDTRGDTRLQSGDVIYIPSVKKTAGIAGEVVRPAIYELKGESTSRELLNLAGGALPTAYLQESKIERITKSGQKTIVDVNLLSASGRSTKLHNGDRLTVFAVIEEEQSVVTVSGHVHRPGMTAWYKGMRISNLLPSGKSFKDNANISAILVMREVDDIGTLEPFQIDYHSILNDKNSKDNLELHAQDKVLVLSNLIKDEIASDEDAVELRNATVKNYTEILSKQATYQEKAKIISVFGSVKFSGIYPLTSQMSVMDAVQLSGGLSEAAYAVEAEITRRAYKPTGAATVEHIKVNLQEEFLSDNSTLLQPHDELVIKLTPEYRDIGYVELKGEVKFPGRYKIYRGETLTDLINRVGGLTSFAHAKAAIFSRQELRIHEQKELRKLQEQLRQELAGAQLENSNIGKASDIEGAQLLLEELDNSEAAGRLIIDLMAILQGEDQDVMLKAGDKLVIPTFKQEVTVIGEVQVPSSHLFDQKFSFDDYIENSGGIKESADDSRIYIVKANGSVVLPSNSSWFSNDSVTVESGDTIVVPLDTSRVDGLELWSKVSSIVYQLALGAAAVNSF